MKIFKKFDYEIMIENL